MNKYSLEETRFVIAYYGIFTAQQLGIILNRSLASIVGLIVRLKNEGIDLDSKLSHSDSAIEKRTKIIKELWQNPEYLKKMEYKAEKASEYMKENNPMKKEENKERQKIVMLNNWKNDEFIKEHSNDNHGLWVGDKIKYSGLHNYMRKYKDKADKCEFCSQVKKLDLANISGEYKRDVNDFIWLCRKCHIAFDMSKNSVMEIIV